MNLNKIKMIVACRNSSGEADMFSCTLEATQDEYLLGKHYDFAEKLAEESGYEGPFVSFDPSEQKNIADQVTELDCPIPFQLDDLSADTPKNLKGSMLFGFDGISTTLEGHSDESSIDDAGCVSLLEYWDGSAKIRAYSDINSGDPAYTICLDGARNSCRTDT